jgi:hypothetical protein
MVFKKIYIMFINNNSELIFIGGIFSPVASKRRKENFGTQPAVGDHKPQDTIPLPEVSEHVISSDRIINYDIKFEINGQTIPIYQGFIVKEF